ncbi:MULTISPECIES: hypothetical protein [Cyanophyceae]|uniref:Uncharacterized protein n=1 Tax=Leptolyngbya subtilissima DQ-A4 TaxID=2933933 RepID=A0ABV0JZ55_9CYAN|nr:hypothetical protein [Nodosilinea sp. FACHB-141]MBD2112405.1 hypothetical protein [Nodosilinea sp. FACHB-141]
MSHSVIRQVDKYVEKINFSGCKDIVDLTKFAQLTAFYVSCLPALEVSEILRAAQAENQYWMSWSDSVGAWISSSGKEIELLVHEGEKESNLSNLTLGFTSALMGACLNLQGQVAIHANAVALNGRAIAFVGPSGAGKSTLSMYCVQQGMELLTDDVLVVDECDRVLLGNPRIKLFPHTGTALNLEVPDDYFYKIFYSSETLGSPIPTEPAPLHAIYLLDAAEVDTITASSVPPTQAIFNLLKNSYAVQEFPEVYGKLLDRYQQLIRQVPVKRLIYPHNFDRLPNVYRFLTEDLKS